MMPQKSQEYTTAGTYTFTVPAGVSCLLVSAVGGGGAGGFKAAPNGGVKAGGAGGGGGEICDNVLIFVTAGGTLSVTVGAGGVRGSQGGTMVNVHRGPEGNTSFGAGNGGSDTTVGNNIRVKGGYAGLSGSNSPHSGVGGGQRAMYSNYISPNNGNCVDNFGGNQGGDGYTIPEKNSSRFFSGSGGGAGSVGITNNGGRGGHMAGVAYSAGGVSDGTCAGGGGGGSTVYGVGGAGGASEAAAPAVPSASYGAGGGGAGGTVDNTGVARVKYQGATGKDGYVLLSWFEG